MTTAEGGMLTGTPEFIAQARIAHMHGMTKDALKRYEKRRILEIRSRDAGLQLTT